MSTVNIDSKLLEALQQSTCFGVAYDPEAPECKQCDVRASCKARMEGALLKTPVAKPASVEYKEEKPKTEVKKDTKPKSEKKVTKPKPDTKPKVDTTKPKPSNSKPSGELPDFKPMSLSDLVSLASEREVEWKDYGNDSITRMRLIMALKKSY